MSIIELLDGPMKGTIHEIAGGFPVPDSFGLPGNDGWLHHYKTNADGLTANHVGCEAMMSPRIQWHYVADEKPLIPKDRESVFVMMSLRQFDGTNATWAGYFDRTTGFKAAKGHAVKHVYAWAYNPSPAPNKD